LTAFIKNGNIKYRNKQGDKNMNETRTELEGLGIKEVFYEAVIGRIDDDFKHVIIRDSIEELNISVNVWLRDGKHVLLSADKVERMVVRLVA
jgi:hypothetical protein